MTKKRKMDEDKRKPMSRMYKCMIAQEQEWKCKICSCTIDIDVYGSTLFDIDHIKEFSEGGSNNRDNLQALCLLCHRKKTNEYMFMKGRMRRINKFKDLIKTEIPKYFPLKKYKEDIKCSYDECGNKKKVLLTNIEDETEKYCRLDCLLHNSPNPRIERLTLGLHEPKDAYHLKHNIKYIARNVGRKRQRTDSLLSESIDSIESVESVNKKSKLSSIIDC